MSSVNYAQLSEDYLRVEQALKNLERSFHEQPNLKEIAKSVCLSEYHFQRLFSRWVGISPKRFLQFLTKEYAKKLLEESKDLLDVAYEAGLSSPGRLYDLFVACEAVTPGEFKNRGEGLKIVYGFHPTAFGDCMLAMTERGICGLAFVQKGGSEQAVAALKRKWKRAELCADQSSTRSLIDQIFNPLKEGKSRPLYLFLKGTNFQIKVWEALLRIPPGSVVSYDDLAVHLGMPNASRAVGNAVAQNPVAFIIPCHRVVRKIGELGGYQWGRARKQAMLGWEAAKRNQGH